MSPHVDLDALAEAFADATPALAYFVDAETGEVVLVSDTLGFIEAGQQRLAMAEHPGRYLQVPESTVSDLEKDVEAFVETLDDDDELAEALDDALDGVDVQRDVAAVYAKREGAAAQWRAFRDARFRERAAAWAHEHGFQT